jgi:hypothetical protein
MTNFIDILPDPDIQGESLYRALHEELATWYESMPGDDQGDIALSFANDLHETAKLIENKVREWTREKLATELEAAGWPAVAEDAREGLHPETILRRLREINEGDSSAAEIVANYT